MNIRSRIILFFAVCAVFASAAVIGMQLLGGPSVWLLACAAILEAAVGFFLLPPGIAQSPGGSPEGDGKIEKAQKKKERAPASRKGGEDGAHEERGVLAWVFSLPRIGQCFYAAALAAAALLVAAFLLLLSEKLLSLAGVSSVLPLSYAPGPASAAIVFLLILPVFSELLIRHFVQSPAKTAFAWGVYLVGGAFYLLVCPALTMLLPAFICGAGLARVHEKTGSFILPYLCSLIFSAAYLLRQYMTSYGLTGGEGMSFGGVFGFGLIALSAALPAFAIAESAMAKRKPKFFEVFAGVLLVALGLVFGIVLAAKG